MSNVEKWMEMVIILVSTVISLCSEKKKCSEVQYGDMRKKKKTLWHSFKTIYRLPYVTIHQATIIAQS
jgi:hypothetical protein